VILARAISSSRARRAFSLRHPFAIGAEPFDDAEQQLDLLFEAIDGLGLDRPRCNRFRHV
jgi:hypothetical protein